MMAVEYELTINSATASRTTVARPALCKLTSGFRGCSESFAGGRLHVHEPWQSGRKLFHNGASIRARLLMNFTGVFQLPLEEMVQTRHFNTSLRCDSDNARCKIAASAPVLPFLHDHDRSVKPAEPKRTYVCVIGPVRAIQANPSSCGSLISFIIENHF